MTEPSPQAILEALTAYQRSAALAGAIELDLFTVIGEGAADVPALARRIGASERGVRSLCDYLVVQGLLSREEGRYGLPPVAAAFLDRRSGRYVGSIATFLGSETLRAAFADVAGAVRRGGTTLDAGGTMAPDHPVWVAFARAMAPLSAANAERVAELLVGRGIPGAGPRRALDVSAAHGHFGISLLSRLPGLRVGALDWPAVLEVARENAEKAGVAPRLEMLPGSALTAELGGPYDLALLPDFLHHFDHGTCVAVLRRVHAALAPGGWLAVVEPVVEEDRVAPPGPASFSLVMLVTTASGDSYTRRELDAMMQEAGFGASEAEPLAPAPQLLLLARRDG